MNKNGYTSVTTWRDDVSKSLGSLETGIEMLNKKMDNVCTVMGQHDNRIEKTEEYISNRKAVDKKMAAVYAGIVAVVTAAANLAFKIFN